ncbi:M50 family metallopeptidase [Christensenella tenuis]|uniref:Site-2 protease family protein n=1 Tax=Christensenella tenuis TaxID=2763033 RepID=A0ABR7EBE0_9FIRM|nr:M50 family metallopeptidase [Christensenella tenuis]MBC5647096.1 site-2 protease family protein [Christensenella tenuis]
MQIVLSIVVTLLVLTALVVAHEFGHYIVAKKRGIKVAEFAIGFGPKLIKWRRGETEFSIRPFFIGGYNKFADDEEKDPVPGDFRAASLKSRFLTIIAGPLMNVIVAVILAAVLLMTVGNAQPVVSGLEQGSTAQSAGIMEGDIIREMNGVRIDFTYDLQDAFGAEQGDILALTVERDGQKISFSVPYEPEEVDGRKVTGMSLSLEPRTFHFFEAIALSFKWLFLVTREMIMALGNLFFMGQGVENMSGIVGVASMVGQAAMIGWDQVINLTALLSINLAIVNLLPIPALDGGKIVLYAVEGIRRKPASPKVEGTLNLIGMVLIFGLAIFLIFQDVQRLIL